jgi:hypothetical protein
MDPIGQKLRRMTHLKESPKLSGSFTVPGCYGARGTPCTSVHQVCRVRQAYLGIQSSQRRMTISAFRVRDYSLSKLSHLVEHFQPGGVYVGFLDSLNRFCCGKSGSQTFVKKTLLKTNRKIILA